jgi:serine/threonine protein kinase
LATILFYELATILSERALPEARAYLVPNLRTDKEIPLDQRLGRCPSPSVPSAVTQELDLTGVESFKYMPLVSGTRLGPYEILAPIGAGGMGEVYKARDTRLDRTVAIKVASVKFSERFEREARAVAALGE